MNSSAVRCFPIQFSQDSEADGPSVIKGSEETLAAGNDNNFLEKQIYLNLSERRQGTFSRQRERIYELFEHYRKLKGERGDYDAADRYTCSSGIWLSWILFTDIV